ncbi:MAG: hypothetical protein V2A76_18215 [Planctomycetota bacterium]
MNITNVHFTPAPPRDCRTGLLGYLKFDMAGLRISGVTLRQTRRGRLTLSFPIHHDRTGRQHTPVRPTDAHARSEIERAVLDAIGPLDPDTGATAGHGGSRA